MLAGVAIALMGVALGAYEWLYFKWWSRRLAPWPEQFSPKRRKVGFLLGEAVAILFVVVGAGMVVMAAA